MITVTPVGNHDTYYGGGVRTSNGMRDGTPSFSAGQAVRAWAQTVQHYLLHVVNESTQVPPIVALIMQRQLIDQRKSRRHA